jgi:hypothetical protein
MDEFGSVRIVLYFVSFTLKVTVSLIHQHFKKVFFIGSCSFDILAMGEGKTKGFALFFYT